jgi:hypothetical protein
MSSVRKTVDFLKSAWVSSQIDGSRNKVDIFTDRLTKALSEPTLALAMEQLMRSVNTSAERFHPLTATEMVRLASSADGPRLHRWLREQTKMVVMMVLVKDDAVLDEVLAEIKLPDGELSGSAVPRQPYAIQIRAKCETPLSHGSDSKAGNATLFRRIAVLATNGNVLELPYYSGNALRGQMRDLLADHFVSSIGLQPDRSKPAVALWFFYALYCGGALEEKSAAMKAIRKELGDHGAVRSDGIREFRQHLPALSLLGCALGNRVLPGHVQFADLRPVCVEWGTGNQPIAEMMSWEFLTRREDHEDHEEHHGMIANTEVLRTGVELEGGIDMDSAMPEMEKSALGCGLRLLAKRGMLGAENRRGLGRVNMGIEGIPDESVYLDYLATERENIVEYLRQIAALP